MTPSERFHDLPKVTCQVHCASEWKSVFFLIGEDRMSSRHMGMEELRSFTSQDQWYFTILLMCVQENMKRSRQACNRGRELRAKYVLCISEH